MNVFCQFCYHSGYISHDSCMDAGLNKQIYELCAWESMRLLEFRQNAVHYMHAYVEQGFLCSPAISTGLCFHTFIACVFAVNQKSTRVILNFYLSFYVLGIQSDKLSSRAIVGFECLGTIINAVYLCFNTSWFHSLLAVELSTLHTSFTHIYMFFG